MKTILWTLTLPAVAIALLGCFSVGTWAGHGEKIVSWEPTLIVETPPTPPAPARPPVTPAAPGRTPDILIANAKPAVATAPAPKPPAPTAVVQGPSFVDPGTMVAPAPEKSTTIETSRPTLPPAETPEKMIDDAAKLDSNSTRRSVYVAVAKRTDLGPNAQIRLVNDTYDNLVSETAIEEVFITLIQNPNFSPAAQHAILKRADDFLSESTKQRITAALTPR